MRRVTEKWEETGDLLYEGKVDSKGLKQGRGIEYTDECSIKANFVDDYPEGKVELRFHADNSYAFATMKRGKLEGQYHQYDVNNVEICNCLYKNGKKHGFGKMHIRANCWFEGTWVDGEFEGNNNSFVYPDGTKIIGKTKQDVFISGDYYTKSGKKIKELQIDHVNLNSMHKFPFDKDPYEDKFIEVRKVEGMGEGLFAKRKIKKRDLVSIYSGILISHQAVDRRRWEFNSNTIEWDSKFSIDVPAPFHLTENYWASLGHKANHSFEPNGQYTYLFHPKFGDVMCIRACRDINKGEEILVNYGYGDHSKGPDWFREAKRKHREQQKLKLQGKREKSKTLSKGTGMKINIPSLHKRKKTNESDV